MTSTETAAGTIMNGVQIKKNLNWDLQKQLELALAFISEGEDSLLTSWCDFLLDQAQP